ncbi:hypothetical protein BAUCODRAFT_62697 [Baudoinia panamericana UAMH 10762]|uniref:EKC/KEOPS complex subunit CGI121 n=1 Tax=Baudoinia panamericana (strain UAMH 10762) TaxID=717646 RepID=M2LYK5_BAUPA|nr:uncharacterized protein BAUCODRAFT_62697 [Baudoinia panamericana UAMH 10762]EMC99792.1 hypothetical protein BAUCODRAFT_62697 [Baudoinia panamericana UAMH 10762]
METVILPHLDGYPLHICLFAAVQNAPFLRQQLLNGNTDFEYAFLDAAVISSRDQVLAACFRAINDQINGRLKSRNVHSEIVFSLSVNNNISESFRRFGVEESTESILAIKVGGDRSSIETHLLSNVDGLPFRFEDGRLSRLQDIDRIQKVYRINSTIRDAEAFILGSMALKGS